MEKTERENKDNIGKLQTSVAVIESKMGSIESTQQQMLAKMDTFSFVPTSTFETYKDYVSKNYVQMSDYQNQVWLVRSLVGVLTTVVIYLITSR